MRDGQDSAGMTHLNLRMETDMIKPRHWNKPLATSLLVAVALGLSAQASATTLTVFAAGTLGKTFREAAKGFEALHPGVTVQPQFGGSVKMVKMVTQLHMPADVVAVADYSVIPKYMYAKQGQEATANWSIGFLRNAITFVYTPKSKDAGKINASNWYQVLSQPGVQIGRSNPNTDPSGYQTLQMLDLASHYYHDPQLEQKVLANAPKTNMRDTETDLIAALQLGQIDYLAIYQSDALQHHLDSIQLPAQINLSDPKFAADYAKSTARTANGELSGRPIVYALTIPAKAPHPKLAAEFIAYLLGPDGQRLMAQNGFTPVHPAYAQNADQIPASLRKLTVPWPGE